MLCAGIIIAGLSSLAGLSIRLRPSMSRVVTVRLNGLFLGLLIVAGGMIVLFERSHGADAARLQMLVVAIGAFGLPFFINCFSLALIERRVRKLMT